MARGRRKVLMGLCCVPLVIGSGYLIFRGPASEEITFCEVCGKEKAAHTFLGVLWRDAEQETEVSAWYEDSDMRTHDHQWAHLCSWERGWGGDIDSRDSFVFETGPLRLLMSATEHVNEDTAAELVDEYEATVDDEVAREALLNRCNGIMSASLRPADRRGSRLTGNF